LSHREGQNEDRKRFVGMLEIPAARFAETAVRAQIVNDAKGIK
jgi:hypothetical protein